MRHIFGFYLFIVIWPSLAGFLLGTTGANLFLLAPVDGTPHSPDVYVRSKACDLERASRTRFEENVTGSTLRRMDVSENCARAAG
jgi:hypothetical protein